MNLNFPKYQFIVSSHSKTRTSILVDKSKLIPALELCLEYVRVRDTQGRDCLNPSILCFINDLKKVEGDFVLFQTTQKTIFDIWYFLCLAYYGTELVGSDLVNWAFTCFTHYLVTDGSKHRFISKEIL